jgi:uncharacterized protein (TIGR02147 family)
MSKVVVAVVLDPTFDFNDCPSGLNKYEDYQEFCAKRYHELKASDATFSFRSFSKIAGFGAPNYLKLVMDKKRRISPAAALKFAKGLRLNENETKLFHYMVCLTYFRTRGML